MIASGNHTSVSCREAAKGVSSVFELLLFNEPHPLSQPLRAASSPIGEPSLTSPERGGRRIAPEGFPAVRRIPIGMYQGEFAETLAAPFGGGAPRSESG